MAAAKGNQYAAKGRIWTQAINRALAKRSRVAGIEAIDELAEKLLMLAEQGELNALKELGDRLEGKASQEVQLEGELRIQEIRRKIIDA